MSIWEWFVFVPVCVAVCLPFAAMGLVAVVQILAEEGDDV